MIRSPKLWLLVLAGVTISLLLWHFVFPHANGFELFLLFFGLPGTFAGLIAAHAHAGSQCAIFAGIGVAITANTGFFWCLFLLISRWQRRRDTAIPSMLTPQSLGPVSRH